ncbi:50S ribosome-binding GTPase [Phormidium tenue FACHB-886]|nr:50S ribosome-binding GTPase [Phormidium tenue FACHB-886]
MSEQPSSEQPVSTSSEQSQPNFTQQTSISIEAPLEAPSASLKELSLASGNSWTQWMAGAWNSTTERLLQFLPVEQAAQKVVQWFSVDEAQVAEILEKVRAELPTTEALLIGKPQSGKSSIVRGMTGVSAEIVGQGFRPHTQHTQRYAYPSNELPLLIFTDTVGLGDVQQETETIVQELTQDLQQDMNCAKILILTVKINDFAIDSLRQIAQRLRQQYPAVPCLLAVTCLHEVYPPEVADHPAHPPAYEQIQRSFAAKQQAFAGLYDAAVLLDFTLEEDGYVPVFYGLEALRDRLADLLPEAEARTIHQLLNRETGRQLGDLYRDVGRRYLTAFAVMAAAIEAIPLPFASMPVLTALQISMVSLLGKLYGQVITPAQAGGLVSTIAGAFLAQAIGRELIKFLPGFGSVIAASWAAAYTWALGEAACVYFGDLMGGKKPDPQQIQAVMKTAFQAGQERFKEIKI